MKGLSLIVPVHNGEDFIQSSLEKYYKIFSEKFKNFEMIIVCNACTDNTIRICNDLELELPLKVVEVARRGKGYALAEGFSYAKHEIIGFLDADDPFDLTEVVKMIDYLNRADMVIASKFKKGQLKYQTSLLRRIFSIAGAIVSRFLLNLNFKDTQGGAKFLRKELWDRLDKNFVCKGFEFDMELLYRAKKLNSKIMEYYLPPKDSDFSTVKMRILPGILLRLLLLRLK